MNDLLERGISDSTVIINSLIGFSKGSEDYPSPLKNAGYRLERIEPEVLNTDRNTVNPDLVFFKPASQRALVTEVKDSHISEETLLKYGKIEGENVLNVVSGVREEAEVTSGTAYAGTTKMEESFDYFGISDFLGVIFGDNGELRLRNESEDKDLSQELEQVGHIDYPSVSYYPFSAQDDESWIAGKLIQQMVVQASNSLGEDEVKFDVEELLSEAHPQWNAMSESGKSEMRRKSSRILNEMMDAGLTQHLKKLKESDKYATKSTKALQEKAEQVIEELYETTQSQVGEFSSSEKD